MYGREGRTVLGAQRRAATTSPPPPHPEPRGPQPRRREPFAPGVRTRNAPRKPASNRVRRPIRIQAIIDHLFRTDRCRCVSALDGRATLPGEPMTCTSAHLRFHDRSCGGGTSAMATIHNSNSRLVGVPADDRIRPGGNRRQLANETPLSPLEKWRLVIIHLRSTYANARFCTRAGQPWFRRLARFRWRSGTGLA